MMKDYIDESGGIYYLIEVRMLSQIWILKKRYSDFDKMHRRLQSDLDFRAAENLPELPPKRIFNNKDVEFIKERQKLLNKYIRFLVLIYEAIENPILQRFLELDTRFNSNYEYEEIGIQKNFFQRTAEGDPISLADDSQLFLEMDKYTKTRFEYIIRNQTGPNNIPSQINNFNEVIKEI